MANCPHRAPSGCRAAGLALVLVLAGCNSTPSGDRPSWVNDVKHVEYPEELYLLAVGAGSGASPAENQEQADAAARRNLILNLRSRVLAITEDKTEMHAVVRGGGGQTSRVKTEFRDFTRILGEGTLDGAEIVRRYLDPPRGTAYALAAVNRHVAAQSMAVRIENLLTDAGNQLAQASPRARSLVPLITAYRLYLEARVVHASRQVLVGGGGQLAEDRGAEARSRLEELLRDVALKVTRGQDQRGTIGSGLTEPVVISVTLRDGGTAVPFSGVALRLEPEHPGAVELSTDEVTTDQRGEARFSVPLVTHTGEAGNHIRVAVDLLGLENLTAPFVDVRYSLPTRETLRVLVLIEERNLEDAIEPSLVGLNLTGAIRTAGFPVVDPALVLEGVGKRQLLAADADTLRSLLGDRVDVVLRGSATTVASGVLLGLPGVQASARIEVIYLRSGRVIIPLEKTVPEADENRKTAGERGLRRLARELAPAVVAGLEKLLTGKR